MLRRADSQGDQEIRAEPESVDLDRFGADTNSAGGVCIATALRPTGQVETFCH